MQPTNVNIDPNMPENVRRETSRGFIPASSQQVMTSDHDNILSAPQPQRAAVPDVRRGATSASGAEADALCPGKHNAERGLPDVPTEEGNMGTRIHAALAGELPVEQLEFAEREIHDNCGIIEARLVSQFFPNVPIQTLKVFRHHRAWVRVPPGMWEHSGECDVLYRYGTRGLIIDYKTLPGDVADSPQNLQLRDLAVLNGGHLLLDEIGVAIVQPLVTWAPEICVYNKAALKRAESEMFERVRQNNRPDAVRTAGEVQCKFCKAAKQGKCAEHQQWVNTTLPVEIRASTPVAEWKGDDFSFFLERLKVAQDWLDTTKEAAKKFLEDGNVIPGFVLRQGAERTTITDAQTVFDRFIELGGTQEQFIPAISIVNGKLKEQMAAVTGAKGKALEKAFDAITKKCTETKRNAPSIVKERKK